jgi:hypothetical protein
MNNNTKLVIYQGKSRIDGKPIVAYLTNVFTKSRNTKIGDMVQLFILCQDMSPLSASVTGDDKSVCGNCPQRHFLGGGCYVNVAKGVNQSWKSWKNGNYVLYNPIEHDKLLANRMIRLGAYGEPTAIPIRIIKYLAKLTKCVGYTHRWHLAKNQPLKGILMASVDNIEQFLSAQKSGWGTFRAKTGQCELMPGERTCNNESKGLTCDKCMLCGGNKHVTITVHGMRKKRMKVE